MTKGNTTLSFCFKYDTQSGPVIVLGASIGVYVLYSIACFITLEPTLSSKQKSTSTSKVLVESGSCKCSL